MRIGFMLKKKAPVRSQPKNQDSELNNNPVDTSIYPSPETTKKPLIEKKNEDYLELLE